MESKQCSVCAIIKPIDEFPWMSSHGQRVRRAMCAMCRSQKRKSFYEKNADRLRQEGRDYAADHREEQRASAAIYSKTPAGRWTQKKHRQSDRGRAYRREYQRWYTLFRYHANTEDQKKILA